MHADGRRRDAPSRVQRPRPCIQGATPAIPTPLCARTVARSAARAAADQILLLCWGSATSGGRGRHSSRGAHARGAAWAGCHVRDARVPPLCAPAARGAAAAALGGAGRGCEGYVPSRGTPQPDQAWSGVRAVRKGLCGVRRRALCDGLQPSLSGGYTEPDCRDDLSGVDVARKAVILARVQPPLSPHKSDAHLCLSPRFGSEAHSSLPAVARACPLHGGPC